MDSQISLDVGPSLWEGAGEIPTADALNQRIAAATTTAEIDGILRGITEAGPVFTMVRDKARAKRKTLEMRCIIAGCRWFTDYDRAADKLDGLFVNIWPDEIVCGMGRGADLLGKQWAEEKGVPVKQFPANWDALGKAAGPKRNQQMAEYSSHLVAFWDSKSAGTRDMLDRAKVAGLVVRIIRI